MSAKKAYVIGSGPNGLMAAITLARAGLSVTVLEAQAQAGGTVRSQPLTLPGFVHDICSAVHPMAIASPAFAELPLSEHGLEWIHPAAPLAHPLDDGSAVVLERSFDATAQGLGTDAETYRRVVGPLVRGAAELVPEILEPLHFPRHPLLLARFGWHALKPASWIRSTFETKQARALFAGIAAHSLMPLNAWGSAAVGWALLLVGHYVGWPIPKGGSQKIADAMISYLRSLGGEVATGHSVSSMKEFGEGDLVLGDITPRQLLKIAGSVLPDRYCRKLEKYRYGPGVFKMDWALSGAIPWRANGCARAATVHLGGTLEEFEASENGLLAPGAAPAEKPFVLLAQPSLFDPTRAPQGQHTAWAYCHVPHGSTVDMSERIEAQVERFAPGFKSRILKRHSMNTADLEKHNANLVGGDISGGQQSLDQLFLRPTRQLYRTPRKGLYLCSASTPPGGGVHGLCGYYAAKATLQDIADQK